MGKIAEAVRQMRGQSLAAIVAEIERLEDATLPKEPPEFAEFYAAYPRHTARPAAVKAYRAALKRKAKHSDIMAGLARFVASCPDPQYTPHPSTWLNQDRWNDEPIQSKPTLKGLAAAKEQLRQEIENDRQPSQARPDHHNAGSLSLWDHH